MSVVHELKPERIPPTQPADTDSATHLYAIPPAAAGSEISALVAWLELVCKMIPGVEMAYAGIDLRGNEDFRLTATWPAGGDCDESMRDAARYAVQRESGLTVDPGGETSDLIARRLMIAPGCDGALVLKLSSIQDGNRAPLLRLLEWAEAWLGLVMQVPVSTGAYPRDLSIDVVNNGLGESTLRMSATAMAAAVATANGAGRVGIGLYRGDRIELIALSHTASFDPRLQPNRDIVAAMEEAIDEGGTVVWPPADTAQPGATRAHERLCTVDRTAAAACTIVLRAGERIIGALTLEHRRGDGFDAAQRRHMEDLAPVVARILCAKETLERPVHKQLAAALTGLGRDLVGPGRLAAKVLGLIALLGVGILFLVDGDLHVAAPATLEGRVHRILTAPIDGYIAEAPARAGDAVKAGDVLAVVDTRSLEFERRRWANERLEFEKAHRKAVAKMDRAEAAITKARLGKANSQLALIEAQLARARITAPFDGILISGDLSRSMGAPVSRGDVLFEIAPLDDYRVELEVDERDVADVVLGQQGHIALTALPGKRLPFMVDTVTGVAETSDGRNVFKVEGRLESSAPVLRPGMHGVGKIAVDRRPLFWVWTHGLVDRVQLWMWSRSP
jgi:Barrel-sandwich domain of CusB or HlyD membrane-fusion/GAF domain